jgi:hypothetical protein
MGACAPNLIWLFSVSSVSSSEETEEAEEARTFGRAFSQPPRFLSNFPGYLAQRARYPGKT